MKEMTVVILGHVDHGKSTLVGRLLYDLNQVPSDRVDFARRRSTEQGRNLEFAFLLDGLEEEQTQGITIDFTQTKLKIGDREFVISDAPGHREFLKNMLSGASLAQAAFLLIDATEGVREQSRRHGYLLSLLGIKQLAVVVNKMDLVGWSEEVFRNIVEEYREFLTLHGMSALAFIPAAAYSGDNLIVHSENMPWYSGPTVIEQFISFKPIDVKHEALRLMVQDIYRVGTHRLLAGRVESGRLMIGQDVQLWPTMEKTQIKNIECWPRTETLAAEQGDCIAVELRDPLFAERGMLLASASYQPVCSRYFRVRVVWLGRKPLSAGQRYTLKLGFQETGAYFDNFDRVIDIGNLVDVENDCVPAGFVGEGIIITDQPVVVDDFETAPDIGRFVLLDGYQIAGGGIILSRRVKSEVNLTEFSRDRQGEQAVRLFPEDGSISKGERRVRNRHHSFVIWFTGLSGSGKSTLARAIEERLFLEGIQTYILDGDRVRSGINKDLRFSSGDRRENIRRVGEVAKLFVDAGIVVLAAFISPYHQDRQHVRELLEADEFLEVYVRCPVEICEQRDTKGLYAKARQGLIRQFTGVDDNYEEPCHAELVVDTEKYSVEESVEQLMQYLQVTGKLAGRDNKEGSRI